MVETHESVVCAEHDPDGIEPKILSAGTTACLRQVSGGHAPHLLSLARMQRLERRAGSAPGLHLAEDERLTVKGYEVQLAVPRAVVPLDDLVTEAGQVVRRKVLAQLAESVSRIVGHGDEGTWHFVTEISR